MARARSGRNDVAAATTTSISREKYWRLIDDAPAEVRRAMWETVVDWSPVDFIRAYDRAVPLLGAAEAARFTRKYIRQYDADERPVFADRFEAKFGTAYPARAARSTITRYERRR